MVPRPFPAARGALPLAALLAAGPAALTLWTRADPAAPPFQGLDDTWLRLMAGPHDGPLWALAVGLDRSGGTTAVVITMIITGALAALRRWGSALYAPAAIAASALAVDLLKILGDRERPPELMTDAASLAFPSGHSAQAAAMVTVVTVVAIGPGNHWWWPAAAVLVLAMMWSRTWLHVHWLSDTVAGASLGLGVAALCWRAFDPLLARDRDPDSARNGDAGSAADRLRSGQHVRGARMSAPPPYPPPPYPPPYGHPYPPPRPVNGMAIAALVLGIVGACNPIGVLGLIFGTIAKRQIAERGEGGEGFATAGIVLGWIGVASIVFWVAYALLVVGLWIPFVAELTDPENWPTPEPTGLLRPWPPSTVPC